MKVTSNQRKFTQGFTLIEMIGVLAVIAILASMLIPKIFEAINSARINNTVQSYNAIKTAVMDHYGKYGALNFLGTTSASFAAGTPEMNAYDTQILLPEAMIDKPFRARVGTAWQIQAAAGAGAVAVSGVNSAYDLDGSGSANNDATPAAFVVQAIVTGVAIADALEISERLDGTYNAAAAVNLTQPNGSANADLAGRVKYAAPVGGITDVYIYVCHR